MSLNEMTTARIYYTGFAASDHVEVKPNCSIVEPIQPPQTTGVIATAAKVRGTMALLYTVVATSDVHDDPQALHVDVGDVVTVRLAHLDPIHFNEAQSIVPNRAIYSIVQRGHRHARDPQAS